MSWPTPQDYQEAMQNPRTTLSDSELQKGHAEEDLLGLPRPISGGFASVYKVKCPNQTWAVRCFLKQYLDQQQRYDAISKQLIVSKFPFATHFHFLKTGIRVQGEWYPIMKMEWVQGESLIRFVECNLGSPEKLLALGNDIVEISRVLNRAGVAHGDLQHGNILVANGKPKLIDYDGMYVSALKGMISHESGHPNYQLPRVSSDFGPNLDNFSVWVIYLSLKALSVRPSLWKQFQGGDDCLLFRQKDFEKPDQSPILGELKRLPEAEIGRIATAFQALLKLSPLKVPFIEPEKASPATLREIGNAWIKTHVTPKPIQQQKSALNFENLWAKIDQIPPMSDFFKILPTPAITSQWPFQTNPPTKPTIPEILVSPPDFPLLNLGPALFHPTPVPKGLFQNSNSEYELERKEREAIKRDHIERFTKLLNEKQIKSQNKFDEDTANWHVKVIPYKKEATRRREAVELAKSSLGLAKQQWKEAFEAMSGHLKTGKSELLRLNEEYTNVINQKDSEWSNLLESARNVQLNNHLKQHDISEANIPGIGSVRKSTLQANGVTTALDVNRVRISLLPGFGWELTESIKEWSSNVEATFLFQKTNAIPKHEKQAFEWNYEHRLQIIQQKINSGVKNLEIKSNNLKAKLNTLGQQIIGCRTRLGQAEANLTVIPKGL